MGRFNIIWMKTKSLLYYLYCDCISNLEKLFKKIMFYTLWYLKIMFLFFTTVVIWCFALGTGMFRCSTLRGNWSVWPEPLPARRIQTLTTNKLSRWPVSTHKEKYNITTIIWVLPKQKFLLKRLIFFISFKRERQS